jgi:hypothetical protein
LPHADDSGRAEEIYPAKPMPSPSPEYGSRFTFNPAKRLSLEEISLCCVAAKRRGASFSSILNPV